MKLSYRITSRLSIALLVLITAWASLFYFIIVEEINDETDDSLDDYSEYIITRVLAGETLPSADNGTNNSYHITEVTTEYVRQNAAIRYYDEMVYIESKKETEPARVLRTIFNDAENKSFELTVSIPTIEKADLLEAVLYWIIFLYLGLLLVIIGINRWILYRSFKPLYILLKWLDSFRVENKITELNNTTDITEFRKLNEAVIRSARRNVETYEQQKLFIAHASHELQTPLAVCRNRLEMLLEDTLLNEGLLEEVLKIKQSIDHSIKLNKTLLLLTRIENNQFPDKKEIVVNEVIKKLLDDFSEVYSERHISISLQEDACPKVIMNETLTIVLFSNLVKNAYIHNYKQGSIYIHITSGGISIANTGPIEALDKSAVFNRFYQGSKKEGSTGLGLTLSKSVCSLYGMDLQYEFSNNRHVFSIHF